MSYLEDRTVEIIQIEQQNEKIILINNNTRDRWDNIKCFNIPHVGIPEEGAGSVFEEIMAENFHNLGKETDIQV